MPCPGTSCPSLKCQAHLGCANCTFSPLCGIVKSSTNKKCGKLKCTNSKCGCGTKVTNLPGSHKAKLFQGSKCIMQQILVGSAVESMGRMGRLQNTGSSGSAAPSKFQLKNGPAWELQICQEVWKCKHSKGIVNLSHIILNTFLLSRLIDGRVHNF